MPNFLNADDLGLNLNEDSEGVTEEEVAGATSTDASDFPVKVADFVRESLGKGAPAFALRRKGGILYCRASIGEAVRFFQVDWLRKSNALTTAASRP